MDEWERYLGSANEPDALTQLAILHVEFEALHPFKDGNGRLGRMLIPLFLFQRKLLASPDFYMSGYLESNREEYQERLRGVSRNDDWTAWCEFFLKGIRLQAAENERKARAILTLYDQVKNQVVDLTHSQHRFEPLILSSKRPFLLHLSSRVTRKSETNHRSHSENLREKGLLLPLQEGKRASCRGFCVSRADQHCRRKGLVLNLTKNVLLYLCLIFIII